MVKYYFSGQFARDLLSQYKIFLDGQSVSEKWLDIFERMDDDAHKFLFNKLQFVINPSDHSSDNASSANVGKNDNKNVYSNSYQYSEYMPRDRNNMIDNIDVMQNQKTYNKTAYNSAIHNQKSDYDILNNKNGRDNAFVDQGHQIINRQVNNQINEQSVLAKRFLERKNADSNPLHKLDTSNTIGYNYVTCEHGDWLDKCINTYHENSEQVELAKNIACNAYYLERKLMKKFIGKKWFGVYGSESSISAIFSVINQSNYKRFIIGMAHRGRLSAIVNIMGYPIDDMISVFGDSGRISESFNDVIYHEGYSSSVVLPSGRAVDIHMLPNASHLESVYPISVGYSQNMDDTLNIITHGDAAFTGQGVVHETINLAGVEGYNKTPTVHIIINNQVGFTAESQQMRYTHNASDVVAGYGVPAITVNGNRIQDVVKASNIAIQYVQAFKKDVVIEVNGLRLLGHNEGDEPRFTNPGLYADFSKVKNPYITEQYVQVMKSAKKINLDIDSKEKKHISLHDIEKIQDKIFSLPSDFSAHNVIKRVFANKDVTWGRAEALAFGVILNNGVDIRISGEDAIRGTFAHRHAILYDQDNFKEYHRFDGMKGKMDVFSSPLSEYGVLGFEFGYSILNTNSINIWEAQFGDFANTAQVMIDQYISCSNYKWNLKSNLIMLLPHGYEGQGPEHSSARIERYLAIAHGGSMLILHPTVPANYFAYLVNQVNAIRPMIVFTPKSLLRNPACKSSIEDVKKCEIQPVIHEKGNTKHLVIASGKICYQLSEKGVSLLRLEQLHPFPHEQVMDVIAQYDQVVVCQEEPANFGIINYLRRYIAIDYFYARAPIPAPIGFSKSFQSDQDAIVENAAKNNIEQSVLSII